MLTDKQIRKYYDELAPKVVNYLVANSCPYDLACDIVQESFIRLWNRRDTLSENDSISGLVFQIARNLRIDDYRKKKHEVLVDDFFDEDPKTTQSVEDTYEDNTEYLRKCLEKALDEIPDDLRTCYTLFNLGELSIKEIAEQLGINESLVKVRIHRAKEKLAKSLAYLKDTYLD